MKKVLKVIGIIAAVAGAIFGVYVIVKNMLTAKKQLSAMTLKIMFHAPAATTTSFPKPLRK